jgi:outer membrane autotransporter protein
VGFVGSNLSTQVFGTKPKRASFQAGAGVKVAMNESFDFYVNYDLDVSKKYSNHMVSGGIGFNF